MWPQDRGHNYITLLLFRQLWLCCRALSKNHRTLRGLWRGVDVQERQETLLVRWPNGSVCHAYTHQTLGSRWAHRLVMCWTWTTAWFSKHFFTPNHISKKCEANWPKENKTQDHGGDPCALTFAVKPCLGAFKPKWSRILCSIVSGRSHFVSVRMNVKPFHITTDGCGVLAI